MFLLHTFRAVTHRLMVTEEGDADLSWGTGAADLACHVTGGSLGFFPCDSALHSLSITAGAGFRVVADFACGHTTLSTSDLGS